MKVNQNRITKNKYDTDKSLNCYKLSAIRYLNDLIDHFVFEASNVT